MFLIRRVSLLIYGVYDWHYNLDIGYCNLTTILFIIYCFSNKLSILKLCYLMSFGGSVLAIIFPCVNFSLLNYSFYYFILTHSLLLFSIIFFVKYNNVKINFKEFLKNYSIILLIMILTYIFNYCFKTNYNYLSDLVNDILLKNSFFTFLVRNNILSTLFLMFINFVMVYFGYLCIRKKR